MLDMFDQLVICNLSIMHQMAVIVSLLFAQIASYNPHHHYSTSTVISSKVTIPQTFILLFKKEKCLFMHLNYIQYLFSIHISSQFNKIKCNVQIFM